eukprot:scaffold44254_cov19-Prasinocladus_malaysianus.AAC.1
MSCALVHDTSLTAECPECPCLLTQSETWESGDYGTVRLVWPRTYGIFIRTGSSTTNTNATVEASAKHHRPLSYAQSTKVVCTLQGTQW